MLLICASVQQVLAQAEIDWRPLVPEGTKHELIYFPLPVEVRLDTLQTATGEVSVTTYYAADPKGRSGNRLYQLMTYAVPPGSFPADSVERIDAFFEATAEEAVLAVGGELKFMDATERAYPGRVFRIDFGERGVVSRNYVYLVGDAYYHLQVLSAREDDGSKSRTRFFDGFSPRT